MSFLWLVILGLLTGQGEPQRPDGPRMPGEKAAVAGLAGFHSVSEVTMSQAPDDPHQLEVLEIFADRTRWAMRRVNSLDRRIEYRFGEHLFVLDVGQRESTPILGVDQAAALRRMALRRAAFLWPDGAAWSQEGSMRTAPALALAADPASRAIGELRLALDGDGLPNRFEVLTPAGVVQESLEILERQEIKERSWPSRLTLRAGDTLIWEEWVTTLEVRLSYHDPHFLPPGQKEILRPLARPERRLFLAETVISVPLKQAFDWDETVTWAREVRNEQAARLREEGANLDKTLVLELTRDARPTTLVLRLDPRTPSESPPGWSASASRRGLRLVLGGTSAPARSHVETLREAIPEGMSESGLRVEIHRGEVHLDLFLAD